MEGSLRHDGAALLVLVPFPAGVEEDVERLGALRRREKGDEVQHEPFVFRRPHQLRFRAAWPEERDRALAVLVLRDGGRDAAAVGVRDAQEAEVARQEHSVPGGAEACEERRVDAPLREALEEFGAVAEEYAAPVRERYRQHAAVRMAEAAREFCAPPVGALQRDEVGAVAHGVEYHVNVALAVARGGRGEHDVRVDSALHLVGVELLGVQPHFVEELQLPERAPDADLARLVGGRHRRVNLAGRGLLRDEPGEVSVVLDALHRMDRQEPFDLLRERTRHRVRNRGAPDRARHRGGDGDLRACRQNPTCCRCSHFALPFFFFVFWMNRVQNRLFEFYHKTRIKATDFPPPRCRPDPPPEGGEIVC